MVGDSFGNIDFNLLEMVDKMMSAKSTRIQVSSLYSNDRDIRLQNAIMAV